MASAATGIATGEPYNCVPKTEDTITLLVDWQSLTSSRHRGTAVYTASWTAPQHAGVHSAQHWYYMAEKVRIPPSASNLDRGESADLPCVSQGEINVDQAHRGYDVTVDDAGKTWYNPF